MPAMVTDLWRHLTIREKHGKQVMPCYAPLKICEMLPEIHTV